ADMRILLMTGIAAGFGAVFGTPVTGAVFALEVIAIGRIKYDALLPCFIASVLGDIVCNAWGISHTHYHIESVAAGVGTFPFIAFDFVFLIKAILAGVAFGLASYLFSNLSHGIRHYANRFIKVRWLIPVIGGVAVIGLTYIVGTRDYLGLGVTSASVGGVSIVNAFQDGGAEIW